MKSIITSAFLLATSPAYATTIYPADAAKHVGETVTVEGVANVHIASSGITYFDIGGRYPNQPFSAVIFAADAGKFANVNGYSGKSIDVTGLMKLYKGKPEIILTMPSQLQAK